MTNENTNRFQTRTALFCVFLLLGVSSTKANDDTSKKIQKKDLTVTPVLKLSTEDSIDQDDYCVWVNNENPGSSYIISSDKSAGKLFVYDLTGKKVDSISVNKPGNIDVAYGFPLNDSLIDIIVVNQREKPKQLIVCTIDKNSGELTRIDNDALSTGKNYGGCLYHNNTTNEFYFISTSKSKGVTQYELYAENGKIASRSLREWEIGKCEGAVANDKKRLLYIAEEQKGVWKLGAETEEETPGELIIKLDENGLIGDIEGLAILSISENENYLILSDQDANTFKVYHEEGNYAFVGDFKIEGAVQSDGIEVINTPLGDKFPYGIFICHSDQGKRAGHVTSLERILRKLKIDKKQ